MELAIITFGPATIAQDFVTALQFVPPTLEASNHTPMGTAINLALDKLAVMVVFICGLVLSLSEHKLAQRQLKAMHNRNLARQEEE